MTAMNIPATDLPAHDWFTHHLPEIRSRAHACFARIEGDRREEAEAEVLASVFRACVRAARRGTLARITPYWAVVYATRQFKAGRRFAGTSSTDATSEATQRRGRSRTVSIDHVTEHSGRGLTLSQRLADRRHDSPLQHTRRNLDYPQIIQDEVKSKRARQLWTLLIETHGQARVNDLANALGVSASRVCQLRERLAEALRRRGYGRHIHGQSDA